MTRKKYDKDITLPTGRARTTEDGHIVITEAPENLTVREKNKNNEDSDLDPYESEEAWNEYKYREYEGTPLKKYKFMCYGCYNLIKDYCFQCTKTGCTYCDNCAIGVVWKGDFYSENYLMESYPNS